MEVDLNGYFLLNFKRIIWRYKLQYLIYISFNLFIHKVFIRKKGKKFSDYLIILSVIIFCLLTIMHQLMTINAIFIYCLIPIFCGLSHIYSKKYLKKNQMIGNLLITLTLCSTFYYYSNYIKNRTFMDLRNVNLENSIDGKEIHPKLSKIKWITMFYPDENQPKKLLILS